MGLKVKRISFRDFRNYPSLDLGELGPLNVFCGPNATGKTNVVEGIQLLTSLTSFRHPTIEQLVRSGCSAAHLEIEVSDGSRELSIACSLGEGKKRYELNGKAKRGADLKGLVPSVTFTPDDLNLVKGSMSVRRTALDDLGSQLSRNYYVVRKDYDQVIRYKNRLLKEEASPDLIESINETLVTCGSQLFCYRKALFGKVVPELARRYGEMAPGEETLTASYIPSWGGVDTLNPEDLPSTPERVAVRERLAEALWARGGEERSRRRSLVGPHADRMEFFIDKRDAGVYGSQGQQRSVVLAFKMAEVAVLESVLHQKPVLLLDDVMSELDESRRRALMGFMADDVQTFITTTNLSYFNPAELASAHIVALPFEGGDVL